MLRSRPPPQRHGQTWPRSHRECPAPKDVGGWAQATNVPYEHEFLWGGAFLFSDSRGAAQFYSTALPIQPPHDSHSRRSPAAEARAGRRGRQAGAVPPRPPAPDGSAARRLAELSTWPVWAHEEIAACTCAAKPGSPCEIPAASRGLAHRVCSACSAGSAFGRGGWLEPRWWSSR